MKATRFRCTLSGFRCRLGQEGGGGAKGPKLPKICLITNLFCPKPVFLGPGRDLEPFGLVLGLYSLMGVHFMVIFMFSGFLGLPLWGWNMLHGLDGSIDGTDGCLGWIQGMDGMLEGLAHGWPPHHGGAAYWANIETPSKPHHFVRKRHRPKMVGNPGGLCSQWSIIMNGRPGTRNMMKALRATGQTQSEFKVILTPFVSNILNNVRIINDVIPKHTILFLNLTRIFQSRDFFRLCQIK